MRRNFKSAYIYGIDKLGQERQSKTLQNRPTRIQNFLKFEE
jgi:hypothetical protein